MKTMNIFAALIMATTTTATAQTIVADTIVSDTVVVIDNSADDEIIDEFLATGDEFDARSNKRATYVDGTKAMVGNSSRPVMLDARMQRRWFLAPSFSLDGTLGENALWGPKFSLGFGYEGNHMGVYGTASYLKARPNQQSDIQGKFNALEVSFTGLYTFKHWNDHHTRLGVYGEVNFRTALDRQDLGTYENVDVTETETEIITTRETGWRAYKVKPMMIGGEAGLELSHQFYRTPFVIFGKAGVGVTTQIAGKESINGSADGIDYKMRCEIEIGGRFCIGSLVKNKKAQSMIRH